MPSDCRDGRQHLYEVPHDEEPITETQQTMRAKQPLRTPGGQSTSAWRTLI